MISVMHPARYARPRRNAFVRDPAAGHEWSPHVMRSMRTASLPHEGAIVLRQIRTSALGALYWDPLTLS
jgi:hypothetical protein